MPQYACILTCIAYCSQVELAQSEYQLPRLTRMWTHLERQAGGKTKGMGEKQIEVDKRLLRTRMGQLKRNLDDVRMHRKQYRERRAQVRNQFTSSLRVGGMCTVVLSMYSGVNLGELIRCLCSCMLLDVNTCDCLPADGCVTVV